MDALPPVSFRHRGAVHPGPQWGLISVITESPTLSQERLDGNLRQRHPTFGKVFTPELLRSLILVRSTRNFKWYNESFSALQREVLWHYWLHKGETNRLRRDNDSGDPPKIKQALDELQERKTMDEKCVILRFSRFQEVPSEVVFCRYSSVGGPRTSELVWDHEFSHVASPHTLCGYQKEQRWMKRFYLTFVDYWTNEMKWITLGWIRTLLSEPSPNSANCRCFGFGNGPGGLNGIWKWQISNKRTPHQCWNRHRVETSGYVTVGIVHDTPGTLPPIS